MCDNPVDTIVNVVANVATGGTYSLVKAGVDTVESGDPSHLLTQGLDLGMAATGNNLATDLGGPIAGNLFNAAGGLAGAAGGFLADVAPGASGLESGADSTLAGANPSGVGDFPSTSLDPTASTTIDPTEQVVHGDLAGNSQAGSSLAIGGQPPPTVDPLAAEQSTQAGLGSNAPATPTTPVSTSTPSPSWDTPEQTQLGTPTSPDSLPAGNNLREVLNGMPDTPTEQESWFKDPRVQAALVGGGALAGGQMIGGAMGGIFNALSFQKQLALQTLINSQNQAQRQYLNANNSSAPALKFNSVPGPAGIISKP